MIVDRAALEASLAELSRTTADPRAGLHGPGSVSWRWNREVGNFVAGGRAALLQLAHPFVAHAIAEHSDTLRDARGRFRRTFENVFAMTFGQLDDALRAARRVHAIHGRIHGTIADAVGGRPAGQPYHANDADALLWVHATLVDSVLATRRLLGWAMAPAEVEAYYQESKRFAALFGIPPARVPVDHAAFQAYLEMMLGSELITVSAPARAIADALLAPPHPALAPAFAAYRGLTAALLPARLRRPFGLPDGPGLRAAVALERRGLALALALLPEQLRTLPAYLAAEARLGRRPASAWSRALDRVALTGLGIWPKPA